MSDDGHGKVHGRFTIPSVHGSMLRKALLAFVAPSRNPDRPANTPTRHQLGLAFIEYLETRPEDTLPSAGGVSATVVVTMTLESLMGGLQAAGLCDGTRISAGEARRLACRAGVIPVVLGGRSQPLDIGRQGRFHTKPQRIALGLRDGGCTTVGCDRPPRCATPTTTPPGATAGAPASSGPPALLRHHTLAHDPGYATTIQPDNKVTFHRRLPEPTVPSWPGFISPPLRLANGRKPFSLPSPSPPSLGLVFRWHGQRRGRRRRASARCPAWTPPGPSADPEVLDRGRVVDAGVHRDEPGTLHRVRQEGPAGAVAELQHREHGLERQAHRGEPASGHGAKRLVREGDRLAGDEVATPGPVECGDHHLGGVPDVHPLHSASRPGGEAAAQDLPDDLVALAEVGVVRAEDAARVDDGDRGAVVLPVPGDTLGLHLALGVRPER